LTTIDQSALSLTAARNPKKGVANDDGHGAAKQEKGAKSFGDLVQDAKQKLAKAIEVDGESAASTASEIEALPEQPIPDPSQKTASVVSGPVRISTSFQQLLRTSNDSRAAAATVAGGLPRSDNTAATTDRKSDAQKTKAADAAGPKPAISPSEQLSILLGIGTANDASALDEPAVAALDGVEKKPKQDAAKIDVADQDRLAETAAVSIAIDVLTEAASQMQAASRPMHQDKTSNEPGGDDVEAGSNATEVVRLVSKDGKGVPIDIPLADKAGAADAEAGSDTTEVVRLVSKDGKGVPIDVPLADKASAADAETLALPGKNTDFVTVLDSRRYLGFSSDTNTTVLTNAIKSDPTWSQALSAVTSAQNAIEGNTSTTVNTLKLQMNPENLGNMTASLRLKGEALTVEVKVETIEAYRQLSGDHDQIVKALKDQGFAIDQVTIQLSAPEKAGQSQDSGSQQQNGQDSREGLGQNARQREDNERRTGNRNIWQNNEQTSAPGDIARTSDDGDIYL